MTVRFGVHATRTEIRVAAVEGQRVVHNRIATHQHTVPTDFVAQIAAECQECARESGHPLTSVGVALEAYVGDDGIIAESEVSPWLDDFDLRGSLTQALGVPVKADAEVHCAAWAEHTHTQTRDADAPKTVLYLGLTRYGGAALVRDDQVFRDEDGYGIYFPHLPLVKDGPLCPCEDRGCLQMYCLDLGVQRLYRERGEEIAAENALVTLVSRADDGDPMAEEILENVGNTLGLVVRAIRSKEQGESTDPFQVVHLDSDASSVGLISALAMGAQIIMRQRSAHLDENVCLIGAAWL